MTSPERLIELAALRSEFYDTDPTEERRIEILTKVREYAEEEMPGRCVFCRRGGFMAPHHKALIEGHCYSEAGERDYTRITMICEFCHDKLFPPDEDED